MLHLFCIFEITWFWVSNFACKPHYRLDCARIRLPINNFCLSVRIFDTIGVTGPAPGISVSRNIRIRRKIVHGMTYGAAGTPNTAAAMAVRKKSCDRQMRWTIWTLSNGDLHVKIMKAEWKVLNKLTTRINKGKKIDWSVIASYRWCCCGCGICNTFGNGWWSWRVTENKILGQGEEDEEICIYPVVILHGGNYNFSVLDENESEYQWEWWTWLLSVRKGRKFMEEREKLFEAMQLLLLLFLYYSTHNTRKDTHIVVFDAEWRKWGCLN